MSLLYDSKTLIQQLRAKYLENVKDVVGERVIGFKNSGLNEKKLFESMENIVEYENDMPLFIKEYDSFLSLKDLNITDKCNSGNISHYKKHNTEKLTNSKCLQSNRSLFPLSAKIVSSIDESDSDSSQLLNINEPHLSKVKFKPKSADVVRRNSKDGLGSMINDHCLILSHRNKDKDNDFNVNSKEPKDDGLVVSYSNEVLNKSLESICGNELSSVLSDTETNDMDAYMNNTTSNEIVPNFFRKKCSSDVVSLKNPSLLSILIKTGKVQVNPLADIYASFSGKGDLNPLKLKIYRPSGKCPKKPIFVVIKRIATVADAIGFSLYCFIEQKLEPKLTNEELNPNMWTLRIVEENGELDNDFPALDRIRFLSKFGFDEFALVEATPEQFLENERLTPFSFKINTDHFNSQEKDNSLNDPSVVSSSSSKEKTIPKTSESFIRLKILLYPRTRSLQNPMLYVTNETYIGNILDEICKMNNLDQTKFVLRTAETNAPLSNDCRVYDLKNQYELELIERCYFIIPKFERSSNIECTESRNETSGLDKIPRNRNLVVLDKSINSSYQKYIVWRRQSMSFMGRHERVLIIDGDYIYIMPMEQKTFFDTPKTLSIHASTIVSCRQTDKLLTFNFTVMKSKELKRYDFEASSIADASSIVAKINSLINSFTFITLYNYFLFFLEIGSKLSSNIKFRFHYVCVMQRSKRSIKNSIMAEEETIVHHQFPVPHTIITRGSTRSICLQDWTVTSTKGSILTSEEIQQFSSQLMIPIPEMTFGKNQIIMKHSSGWKMTFSAYDALEKVDKMGKGVIQVSYADEWMKKREKSCKNIGRSKYYDWTFTTTYQGTVGYENNGNVANKTAISMGGIEENKTEEKTIEEMENSCCVNSTSIPSFAPSNETIPIDKLKRQDPILFFEEILLYEDELSDNGLTILSVKLRIMPERLLLLQRFFMRLDNVIFRIRDTRVYIEFATGKVLREYVEKEGEYQEVLKVRVNFKYFKYCISNEEMNIILLEVNVFYSIFYTFDLVCAQTIVFVYMNIGIELNSFNEILLHNGYFFTFTEFYKDTQRIPRKGLKSMPSMFSTLSSIHHDRKDMDFQLGFFKKIALWIAPAMGWYRPRSVSIRRTRELYMYCAKKGLQDENCNSWYSKHLLPPSFQTWFHITMLHVWMLMVRIRALPKKITKMYQQEFINHFFEDCEYRMRNDYKIRSERIISLYMKDLLMQFHGSVFAYDEGLYRGDSVLALALWRNLYAGKTDINLSLLAASVLYVRNTLFELDNISDDDIQEAKIHFLEISDTFELKNW
ncbi:hypothetical protein PORY_000699 [Pneumocystis oryctolagi]|uniref:Uncharacterized protein n=1 Tax=Pneumocystis oryctolagi TaxID=42067 RepID=A0ACB7CFV2_9ASCO|nr:hypothetical protein PORY_000699 [Pneumocystis oryctolagi]